MIIIIMTIADFFPFGVESGDMFGPQAVDALTEAISVDSPIVFFLENYRKIYVSAIINHEQLVPATL